MYKLIESYDANGDLLKDWFVKYHFLKPDQLRVKGQDEWHRFTIGNSINCFHTKTERRKQLAVVKRGLKMLLKSGFNPFVEFNMCDVASYEGLTIRAMVAKYIEEVEHDTKHNTFRKYKAHVELFRDWILENGHGSVQIYNVKKDIVYGFLKYYQAKRDWENKTYNHYLNSIQGFFEHLINNHDDLLDKNPCKSMKRLKPNKKGNRPFDNHEFKSTLDHLKEHSPSLYNFCRFVYYSCFRPDAECRLVKISDIDLHSRRIRVGHDITKAGATQVIPIDDEFSEFISSLELHKYPRNYYVFGKGGAAPGPSPAHNQFFSKYFAPIKVLLGLHPDVTLYAFKHTRAIHMVEDGEDLFNIIKFTRHKSLATLMDYLKDMGVIIGETKKFKSRKI